MISELVNYVGALLNFMNLPIGLIALAVTFMYVLRVTQQEWKTLRKDYVLLHIFLGIGCAAAAVRLMSGYNMGWGTVSAIVAAVCHLSVTHKPGEDYVPPVYMHSQRGDL